jgi:hypothetical protein
VKSRLWLLISLFAVVAILVGGCTIPIDGHPKGMKSPRLLTDDEKAKVIEIALKTPEAVEQLKKDSHYSTKLNWIAIVWENSHFSEWRAIAYDWEKDPNLSLVSGAAEFYSEVIINFGEPPQWQVYVAVNPDTEKAVFVQENPFRTGPTPPPAPEPGVTPVERPADLTGNLRWLTEEEKARVIEIAMNTPEAKEARERYGVYRTGLSWVAMKKNESGGTSSWGLDYEMVDNIPENVAVDAKFYSQAEIYFGEPEQLLMRIAIDLDKGEVVDVERHGLKILPR